MASRDSAERRRQPGIRIEVRQSSRSLPADSWGICAGHALPQLENVAGKEGLSRHPSTSRACARAGGFFAGIRNRSVKRNPLPSGRSVGIGTVTFYKTADNLVYQLPCPVSTTAHSRGSPFISSPPVRKHSCTPSRANIVMNKGRLFLRPERRKKTAVSWSTLSHCRTLKGLRRRVEDHMKDSAGSDPDFGLMTIRQKRVLSSDRRWEQSRQPRLKVSNNMNTLLGGMINGDWPNKNFVVLTQRTDCRK